MQKPIPYVNPVRDFALYLAGKCGNTTLRDWFMANLGAYSLGEVIFRLPEPHRRRFLGGMVNNKKLAMRIWIQRSRSNTDVRDFTSVYRAKVSQTIMAEPEFQKTYKIAVVRNPASRVISAYIDKFCGEDLIKDWVKEVVCLAGEDEGISFNQFLDFLLAAEPEFLNGHWKPLSVLFEGIQFDRIIKLERLTEGFKEIQPIVGSRGFEILEQKRQSQIYLESAISLSEDIVNTSSYRLVQEIRNLGGVPPKDKFLTEETRNKIAQIYRRDFEIFGYSPP